MEGLLDAVLRDVLTATSAYDFAVTEFVRVSNTVLPARFFQRVAPELHHGSQTASGVPVRIQLMGSDPMRMADNAARAVSLSPAGIDLNFGCPAPLINRHGGGAVLLDTPDRLFEIAAAVRARVPPTVPFSAKMRLGVKDTNRTLACAQALAAAEVDQLIVHARTKVEGYRPPAHWAWVRRIAQVVPVPVMANGEIWTYEDWQQCCAVSGVTGVMLGRGAVADPFLAQRIRLAQPVADRSAEWFVLQGLLARYWIGVCAKVAPRHAAGRFKQWLGFLRRTYPQAQVLFETLRPIQSVPLFTAALTEAGIPVSAIERNVA